MCLYLKNHLLTSYLLKFTCPIKIIPGISLAKPLWINTSSGSQGGLAIKPFILKVNSYKECTNEAARWVITTLLPCFFTLLENNFM